MSQADRAAVRWDIGADRVARLTLDQPDSRANTLHRVVWEQLSAACHDLTPRTDLRGLIIQSAKPGIFIAGADLRELAALPADDLNPARELVRRGLEVLDAIEQLPFPTAALIDGACLGGGMEVALACDFRLAGTDPKVKLGLPEVKLGLIPGWGGTQRLPRLIGFATAAPLICTGEPLTGAAAQAVGLVRAVVPSGQLVAAAEDLFTGEAASPTWPDIRRQKQSPCANADVPDGLRERLEHLADDERPAAQAALRVLCDGAPKPLTGAIRLETAEFVSLVVGPAARRRIGAFLNRS
jgi:enoyl-CoA hydratase/carnithine racemase